MNFRKNLTGKRFGGEARRTLHALLLLAALSCTDTSGPKIGTTPAQIVIVSGVEPGGYVAGTTIPTPIVIQVTDAHGLPVPGTELWIVSQSGGLVTPNPAVTDGHGKVELVWTLGRYYVGLESLEISIPAAPSVPPVTVSTTTISGQTAYVFVQPTAATLYQGTSLQFASHLSDANFNTVAGAPVAWASSNPASVGVSSSGVVTALAPGEATVTATSNGITAAAMVTVPVPAGPGGPGIPSFTLALNVERDKGITIVRSDDSFTFRLTCGTQCSFLTGPAWSRDGSMVALTGQRDTMSVLFVANRDGSNLHEVRSVPRVLIPVEGQVDPYWPPFQPDWSADGRLVYSYLAKGSVFNIEIANSDGAGRTTVLTRTNPVVTYADLSYVNNARWGLGDSMITAVIGDQIYGMNPDGTGARALTPLTTKGGAYIWSPDRRSIAFSRTTMTQGTISILDPSSGGVRQINVPALRAFCWSPNSGAFSIVTMDPVAQNWSSLYIVQADGSGLRKVVTAIMDVFNGVVGAWSPDGRFLVYTDDRRWSGGPVGPQLYAQSIDEGTNTKLSDITKIVWFTIAEVDGCAHALVYPSP